MSTPINRAALQKMFADNKANQANQITSNILNNIRNIAASGSTSYLYDTTRTTFGVSGPVTPTVRGPIQQTCMTPLPELIALLKSKLGDCTVVFQVTTDARANNVFNGTTVDASGNPLDENGNLVAVSGTIVKKGIYVSWA